MITQIQITPNKTYATRENAVKAVDKKFDPTTRDDLRYFIHHEGGRFFPVFVGESAVRAMVHFHFNVIA